MNKEEYISLLYNPDTLNANQAEALGSMVQQYPYLQSARALYLKALYNAESYRYNTELKKTAAYTTDRSVLFEFITSDQFTTIKQQAVTQETYSTEDYTEPDYTEQAPETTVLTPAEEPETIREDNESSDDIINEEIINDNKTDTSAIIQETEKKLEIGRPLEFVKQEKHSFQEWLQLSKLTPVNREEEKVTEPVIPPAAEEDKEKNKKLEIIDKFIEANPKISPVKNAPVTTLNIDRGNEDTSYLMTETLARVYLEQKKYQKAIQAYEILILKYPEKSIYFADLILDIKNLQQNNNN